jgi:manganese oxidase
VYRFLADRAVGAARLSSLSGDGANSTLKGLYGALVVEPRGSRFDAATGPEANVTLEDGRVVREHVLQFASADGKFESGIMPYTVDVAGITSVNYRSEPLWERVGGRIQKPNGEFLGGLGTHPCQFDTNSCTAAGTHPAVEVRNPANPLARHGLGLHGDPETPVLHARAGQALVIRAVAAAGDQLQTFALDGHWWDGGRADLVAAQVFGPGERVDAWIDGAAPGGAGDYEWSTHRDAFREGGAWGLLRAT